MPTIVEENNESSKAEEINLDDLIEIEEINIKDLQQKEKSKDENNLEEVVLDNLIENDSKNSQKKEYSFF